jgi:hypothetical protein
MHRRSYSIFVPFAVLFASMPARGQDVNEIVRLAAVRQRESEQRTAGISHDRIEVQTDFDSKQQLEESVRRLYVFAGQSDGVLRRELLEVDGRAATDEEKGAARKEDERRRRTPGDDEGELMSGRLPLHDLLHRLDFRFVREEILDGRPSYLVEFRPKPGLISRTTRDRVLNNIAGLTWIDVAQVQVRKIEGHLTQSVKLLGGAVLDLRRVRIVYEGREVFPDVWAPCREEIQIAAKVAFLIGVNKEIRFEFSNFRGPDSRSPALLAEAGADRASRLERRNRR